MGGRRRRISRRVRIADRGPRLSNPRRLVRGADPTKSRPLRSLFLPKPFAEPVWLVAAEHLTKDFRHWPGDDWGGGDVHLWRIDGLRYANVPKQCPLRAA